jgi:hypothetical protein
MPDHGDRPKYLCVKCGYDLSGQLCPECGTAIGIRRTTFGAEFDRSMWRWFGLFGAGCGLVIGFGMSATTLLGGWSHDKPDEWKSACFAIVVIPSQLGAILGWLRMRRWVGEREMIGWLLVPVCWTVVLCIPIGVAALLDKI